MTSDHLRQAAAHAGAALAVLGLMTVLAVAGAFVLPPGTGLAVIGDPAAAMAAIVRADGLPVAAGPFAVTALSAGPGFAARLYGAGAFLVIAVPDPGGCVGLPVSGRKTTGS